MRFRSVNPNNELKNFVASYFQWSPLAEHQIETLSYQTEALPIDLGWSIAFIGYDAVFYGKQDGEFTKLDSIAVAGQQTSSLLTKTSQRAEIFGVNLLPASLPLLFSIPASELTDKITDIAPLAKFGLREIGSCLSRSNKFTEKISILERFLRRRIYQADALDQDFAQAISILQRTGGALNVEQVARECGISIRKWKDCFITLSASAPKNTCGLIVFAPLCCWLVSRLIFHRLIGRILPPNIFFTTNRTSLMIFKNLVVCRPFR